MPSINIDMLHDPVVESYEFGVHGIYAEQFWLPVAGPTCMWLLRRLYQLRLDAQQPTVVDVEELAAMLGVGPGVGPNSTIVRSFQRLNNFGLVQAHGSTVLVRSHVAPLSPRRIERLPERLQRDHRSYEHRSAA